MMFFFKPKVIHLDCFTSNASAFELFPIDYSYKFYPDWWKKLPKKIETENERKGFMLTMKGCVGLTEFYQNSITIPLWTDFLIKTNREKGYYDHFFSDGSTTMGQHAPEQMQGLYDSSKYLHIKILSPWHFNCKEDVRFTWTQPTWNFNPIDQILIPPAIIDYKYQNGTNINFFLPIRNEKHDTLLECGQPLVNISPMSERKVKLHNHLLTNDENLALLQKNRAVSFFGKYNKIKKIMQSKEKKCPFGFK